jgi:hypothetical protein
MQLPVRAGLLHSSQVLEIVVLLQVPTHAEDQFSLLPSLKLGFLLKVVLLRSCEQAAAVSNAHLQYVQSAPYCTYYVASTLSAVSLVAKLSQRKKCFEVNA